MSWLIWAGLALVFIFGGTAFIGAPYVPSRRRDLKLAFDELYTLGSNDLLVDIGSGDGVVLRMAAARGATAIGYEINPILVLVARWLGRTQSRVTTKLTNFWRASLPPETTVVYLFGDGRDIKRLDAWLTKQAAQIETRLHVISYGFELPGQKHIRSHGAHHLYRVSPLQTTEA